MKRELVLLGLALLASAALAGSGPDPERVRAVTDWLPDVPAGLGPACSDRSAWEDVRVGQRLKAVVREAANLVKKDLPPWSDGLYLDYSLSGMRPPGERMMNDRKARLYPLVVAECLEFRGRFLPAIEEVLTGLASQPTWTWPAHDRTLRNFRDRHYDVDLFAADTAHDLAQALYLLGDRIDGDVRRRVLDALEARVFHPMRQSFAGKSKDNGWLKAQHNWNAVCLKGVVAAALAVLPERTERALFATAAEHYIRNYLAGFPEDGYSPEGPGYWNYGFSHFVELREVLMQATAGRLDLFADPKVGPVARYGTRIEMAPGNIAAFSDASPRTRIDGFTLAYSNEVLGLGLSLRLADQPLPLRPAGNSAPLPLASILLFARPDAYRGEVGLPDRPDPLRSYFEWTGVLVTRPAPESGSTLAASIKGGGNGNHNHDDIGSFTVALGDEQPVGDVGRPAYTRKTFGPERYAIRAINSYGHPVPVVAGRLQKEASRIRVKVLRTRFEPQGDEILLDLAPAYALPLLRLLTRSLHHEREGGGRVSIEDRFEYTSPQSFETALTTLGEWQVQPEGSLLLWQKNERLRVRILASAEPELSAERIEEEGLAFTRIAIRLRGQHLEGWVRMVMYAEPASPAR